MAFISVTPDNYQAVLDESAQRLVVLGFVDDYRLLDTYAEADQDAWLFGRVADTEQNRSLAERHDVSERPTLVALRDGRELAHTRVENVTAELLRSWLDTMLHVSISDLDAAEADAVMPRIPET